MSSTFKLEISNGPNGYAWRVASSFVWVDEIIRRKSLMDLRERYALNARRMTRYLPVMKDQEKMATALKRDFGITLETRDNTFKGWNWGVTDFQGVFLSSSPSMSI